jgi:hypothetical protein
VVGVAVRPLGRLGHTGPASHAEDGLRIIESGAPGFLSWQGHRLTTHKVPDRPLITQLPCELFWNEIMLPRKSKNETLIGCAVTVWLERTYSFRSIFIFSRFSSKIH